MGSIRCQEFEGNYDTSNYVNWIRSRVCQDKKKRRISIKLCILPLIAMCFVSFLIRFGEGEPGMHLLILLIIVPSLLKPRSSYKLGIFVSRLGYNQLVFFYIFFAWLKNLIHSKLYERVVSPAYELDIQWPWCNDSKHEDRGYPLPFFDHISSIDIHRSSKTPKFLH